MPHYQLLIKAPGWSHKAITSLIDSKLPSVVILEAHQIADTKLWSAFVEVAPWRVKKVYDWFGEQDRTPHPFPPGCLLLFTERPAPYPEVRHAD
jgi:hypothetical protein